MVDMAVDRWGKWVTARLNEWEELGNERIPKYAPEQLLSDPSEWEKIGDSRFASDQEMMQMGGSNE